MQSPTPDEFDAPLLKAAARHCWADEQAPPLLRARIEQVCGTRGSANRLGSLWWRMVIAAGVAVAIVGPRWGRHPVATRQAVPAVALASLPVWTEVVRKHDQCAVETGGAAPSVVHRGQDGLIAAAMRRQLARPVLVGRPADPGWDCRRAGVCQVGGTPTGHVVYVKDGDTLSVFSLPHAAAPAVRDSGEFELVKDGHRIVGFAERGAVFALVGSGPAIDADLPHLRTMRGRMETEVLANHPTASDLVASR